MQHRLKNFHLKLKHSKTIITKSIELVKITSLRNGTNLLLIIRSQFLKQLDTLKDLVIGITEMRIWCLKKNVDESKKQVE